MRWRSTCLAAALLVAGALLGWLAGSGRLNATAKAEQSRPVPSVASSTTDELPAKCCDQGASRDAFLVRADVAGAVGSATKKQDGKKPNILVIWGDDIGQSNISAYSHGVM